MWLFLVWIVIFGGFSFSRGNTAGNAGEALAYLSLMLALISLFWGPQILRNDLRQDLPATDVLKMFPLPGWQVVLGEALAPAAILAGVQWLLLLLSLLLFPNHVGAVSTTFEARAGIALAAAMVLPCVDLIAIIIPNAALLFFPAWFQLGKDGPRGFETTGQQLILMFGQFLVLVLSLLLPGMVFALAYIISAHFLPMSASAPLSGAFAALCLLIEAGVGIRFLGGVFERFDLSRELLQSG